MMEVIRSKKCKVTHCQTLQEEEEAKKAAEAAAELSPEEKAKASPLPSHPPR